MASELEHSQKKNTLTKPEDAAEGCVLTPLYEVGEKGGNPESPAPLDAPDFEPRDPMGYLPKGAVRGKK